MSDEIQGAVQIIRVTYDGIEIAMKMGSGTIEAMQQTVRYLIALLEREKTMGKTSMKKLLLRGGDLQVFQFQTEDMSQVEKMAKKYGILYSVLPDINPSDGLSEIIFHSEAVPRFNILAQNLGSGKLATFDEYLQNGTPKSLGGLLRHLKQQKGGNESLHTEQEQRANTWIEGMIEQVGMFAMEQQSISVEEVKDHFAMKEVEARSILQQLEHLGVVGEGDALGHYKVMMEQEGFLNRIQGYQALAKRMQAIAASQDSSLTDITISKQLVVEENGHAVKTRVPKTWGKEVRYLWVKKEDLLEIHDGKTMLTYLSNEKQYKLYNQENQVVETVEGKRLFRRHYDKVNGKVRTKYETMVQEPMVDKMTQLAPTTRRR